MISKVAYDFNVSQELKGKIASVHVEVYKKSVTVRLK